MSVCDWFVRSKSFVYIRDSGVMYDPNRVNVIDERKTADDIKRPSFDEWVQPFECNPADCAFKTPETVESVLNQFIALGHDKPVVVIKGETMLDGSERWCATIDGEHVKRTTRFGMFALNTATLNAMEDRIIANLKGKLATTVKTETTITY